MKGHQILYTSCKRGIAGVGTGFQVWSCDAETLSCGLVRTPEYRKLFVVETPSEVGSTSFGYALLDEYGPVFNLNTRLAHDYAGEGTRSGNLLNHAVAIGDASVGGAALDDSSEGDAADANVTDADLTSAALEFYPVEVFGADFWRIEMLDSEVNNDNAPPCLPLLDVKPAGVITLQGVSSWIEEGDRLEHLEGLLSMLFDAIDQNKALAIIGDPCEVINWIAAVEFCLPKKLASLISFQNLVENLRTVQTRIIGIARPFVEEAPQSVKASCIIFDPFSGEAPECRLSGSFLDYIDMNFDLNPDGIAKFTSFVDVHVDAELEEESLNIACGLFELAEGSVSSWNPDVAQAALAGAPRRADSGLLQLLTSKLLYEREEIESLSPPLKFAVLGYLIGQFSSLDADGSAFVESVAVANLIDVMQESSLSEAEFHDRFKRIADACAKGCLDIFDLVLAEGCRTRFFGALQNMQVRMLGMFCDVLDGYVLAGGVYRRGFDDSAPLKALTALGELYAALAYSAMSKNFECGLEMIKGSMERFPGDFGCLRELALRFEQGMRSAYAGSKEIALPFANADEELWKCFVDGVCVAGVGAVDEPIRFLVVVAKSNKSARPCLLRYFKNLLAQCDSCQEASALFLRVSDAVIRTESGVSSACFPDIADVYLDYLSSNASDEDEPLFSDLLRQIMRSGIPCSAIGRLVPIVTKDISLRKPRKNDMDLVRRLREYETTSGIATLSGKATLLDAALALEEAATQGLFSHARLRLEELKGCLSFDGLSKRELRDYLSWVSASTMKCAKTPQDICAVLNSYGMPDSKTRSMLMESLIDAGAQRLSKRDGLQFVVLVGMCVVFYGCSEDERTAVSSLAKLKDEQLEEYILPAGGHWIRRYENGDPSGLRKWKSLVYESIDFNRGIFGIFK